MKLILFIVIITQAAVGFSQSELALKVMGVLESDTVEWYSDLIAEKIVPNEKNESILVLPLFIAKDEYSFTLKTWIVRINNLDGTILNKIAFQHESDAIMLNAYSIDTAPYQVSPTSRAFGIRAKYANQSQPNPYRQETLTLLVNSRNSFDVILDQFEVKSFHGETDTNCNGEYTDQSKVLIIQNESNAGYFDISVKNTIVDEVAFVNELNDCDSTSTSRVEKTRLRFMGGRYQEVD